MGQEVGIRWCLSRAFKRPRSAVKQIRVGYRALSPVLVTITRSTEANGSDRDVNTHIGMEVSYICARLQLRSGVCKGRTVRAKLLSCVVYVLSSIVSYMQSGRRVVKPWLGGLMGHDDIIAKLKGAPALTYNITAHHAMQLLNSTTTHVRPSVGWSINSEKKFKRWVYRKC